MSSAANSSTAAAAAAAAAYGAAEAGYTALLALHLDNTLLMGMPLVGLVFASILFGVLTLQVFNYFLVYSKDRLPIRLCVIIVYCMNIAHIVCVACAVYWLSVSNWGSVASLSVIPPTWPFQLLLNSWITLGVQVFFIYRIFLLSHGNYYLIAPTCIASFAAVFVGTYLCVLLNLPFTTPTLYAELIQFGIAWTVTTATSDGLIVVILVVLLMRLKTPMSTGIINKLVAYTVHTGGLAAFTAAMSFALLLISERTELPAVLSFCLGHLYANSLMAHLNSRSQLQADDAETAGASVSMRFGHPSARKTTVAGESIQLGGLRLETIGESIPHGSCSSVDDKNISTEV